MHNAKTSLIIVCLRRGSSSFAAYLKQEKERKATRNERKETKKEKQNFSLKKVFQVLTKKTQVVNFVIAFAISQSGVVSDL